MKLTDGLKLRGRPAEIPSCSRNDLPEFFWSRQPNPPDSPGYEAGDCGLDKRAPRGVEIGVYKAEFSEVLAKGGLDLTSIDPWRLYKDYGNSRGQRRLDEQFRQASERLAPYPNARILRKTSMEALDDFPDGSLDFVYIDGNHQFAYIAEDLYHWSIKVRPGGIISGHDYAYYASRSICGGCHVHEVVDAFVKAYGIRNFWVLGRKEYREGERRDRWRSWMFVKTFETPQHVVEN